LHHAIPLKDLVEHVQGPAAFHHEIFRDDFKPVYDRLLLKNMVVVRYAQTDADAVIFVSVKTICWHKSREERNRGPDVACAGPLRKAVPVTFSRQFCKRPFQGGRSWRSFPGLYSHSYLWLSRSRLCLCRSSGPCRHAFLSSIWMLFRRSRPFWCRPSWCRSG